VTEHPGEQFPPDVDPDVEPGFDPFPGEETPQAPDYDTEPAPQNLSYGGGSDEPEVDAEAAFEASLDEPAEGASDGPAVAVHVDPAEVEFGPEFARAPGQEHEHSFTAESAVAEQEPAEEPAHADVVAEYPAEDVVPEEVAEEEQAHPLVEETMGRLDELRDRPVAEHAEVYADLHERLQSALVEADAEPGDRG
jgi:hypothetical protein